MPLMQRVYCFSIVLTMHYGVYFDWFDLEANFAFHVSSKNIHRIRRKLWQSWSKQLHKFFVRTEPKWAFSNFKILSLWWANRQLKSLLKNKNDIFQLFNLFLSKLMVRKMSFKIWFTCQRIKEHACELRLLSLVRAIIAKNQIRIAYNIIKSPTFRFPIFQNGVFPAYYSQHVQPQHLFLYL